MKMRKIQEEAKAKVKMVFAEKTQENTPNIIRISASTMEKHACVLRMAREACSRKAHGICRGCNPPDVIIRSLAIMVPERCWVFDSVSA